MSMITIGNNIKINSSDLMRAMSEMETKDLERFLHQMSLVLARKKSAVSSKELELLDFIYKKFPLQERYDLLQDKLNNETISPEEHQELLKLVEKSEAHNVEWLKAMIELAQLRTISLDKLMLQLGFDNRHKLLS